MKVIFLDFDGVITTMKSRWNLCKEKMELVKEIVDKTGAKIVISSSWRHSTLESTLDYITTLGNAFVHNVTFLMPEDVVGVTDRIYYHKCSDKKKHEYHVCRGVEIEHYLYEHPEIKNYVILDDDSDMLLSQRKHFVKTHTLRGISKKNVETAIKILNSK